MESRVKLFGHPAHPVLVVFPLGLWLTAVLFDLAYLVTGSPTLVAAAYWMIAMGLLGGLVAAPFGLIDWLAVPKDTRAKAIGFLHGSGNLIVLLLFGGSWLLRRSAPDYPGLWAHVLAFLGAALVLVTGWLGGELVDRLGVGVDDDAHLNAPSSLSGKPNPVLSRHHR
ncbi:DUF2231 domain-containing protein [Candidatus Methylocalor cossyra]|uniref:Membrane protein n=1 Tax=Candidatus Methylocalor cossyra TaxID=3108543 RepID=A0ABP1C4H0_9GAMM